MRTIETTIYTFDELSDTAKQEAIYNLSDINIDGDWYEYVYEDAQNIGLKITSFDEHSALGHLTAELPEVCKDILLKHGDSTSTHQLALKWQHKHGYDNEEEFSKLLLEEYRIMLQQEWEYLTSEEAIIDTIEANEYEFTESGQLS